MSTPNTATAATTATAASKPNWPIRVTLTVSSFGLSFLAGMVIVSTAHLGAARLLILLAFMSLAPGAALLNLVLPDLADWATTLLLAIGASLALDMASAWIALWAHAWNPIGMVGTLAMLTVTLSGLSLVRLQMPFAFPLPAIHFPRWARRLWYGAMVTFPAVALGYGLVFESLSGHPRRALTGYPGGVAAGFAAVAVVLVMFVASATESPEGRRRRVVVSSILVAFVAVIVTARFVLIA